MKEKVAVNVVGVESSDNSLGRVFEQYSPFDDRYSILSNNDLISHDLNGLSAG